MKSRIVQAILLIILFAAGVAFFYGGASDSEAPSAGAVSP